MRCLPSPGIIFLRFTQEMVDEHTTDKGILYSPHPCMSSTFRFWLLAALLLCPGRLLFAQAAAPAATATDSADAVTLLQDFLQQQQALAQSYQTLLQQGATSQQIQAWQTANAAVLQQQQERAVALAAYSAVQPLAYVYEVNVPAGASQTMDDFLMARADLFNRYVELHNQAVASAQAAGTTSSESDVQAAFQSQNAAELQAQAQRAQAIAAEPATQPLPVPPPLVVPPGTSPVMAAFLVLRDQLARQHIALWNQFVGQSVAIRDAAIQQWQQQNQASFQQMQQLAQQMAQTSGN